MKADLSRSTFDRVNHYRRALIQQGRVHTDADANEAAAITLHRIETEAADLIGGCGGPIHDAGFAITPDGTDLLIGPGRYYVDGVLCENDEPVRHTEEAGGVPAQPDYPLDAAFLAGVDDPPVALPTEAGTYLAYLDVWERHLTPLEAPAIREVALGGPDTATRTKTVWQVKLHQLTEDEAGGEDGAPHCLSTIPSWDEATAPSTGQLGARAEEAAPSDDPCIVTPGAGYRRLENQLYRVEVHEGGTRNAATYKWDRDNGTVVARLEAQSADLTEWTLSSVGRDAVLRVAPDDWVELTDDTHELHGLPGTLVQVDRVEGDVITVHLGDRLPAGASVDMADFPRNAKVRRWNNVLRGVTNQNFQNLEGGVQVRVRGGNGPDDAPRRYRPGDYWLIPARTNTGEIEWPTQNEGWRPAEGVHHSYCRLSLLTFDGEGWADPTDCRTLFPPVTELTSLFYVSGDGQQGTPGDVLPYRLQVGAANGGHRVAGARVRFAVVAGGGRVNGQPQAEVSTGADGTAAVEWTLGDGDEQQVEAVLLNAAGQPVHLPIRFVAGFAVDVDEPGLHVTDLRFTSGDPLRNDTPVPVALLGRGITVECDGPVEEAVVRAPASNHSKPVCFVTLQLPFPFNEADMGLWGSPVIGTRPLRLDAQLHVDDNEILWIPTDAVRRWLNDQLFPMMEELDRGDQVLAYLTLEGDVIWAREEDEAESRRYLDGEVFGELRADGGTDVVLPSGDRRRGGDLEVWFWLRQGEIDANPRIRLQPEELGFGTVAVGGSEERAIAVHNDGDGPLRAEASTAPDVFAVASADAFVVEPGGRRDLRVRFAPDAPGEFSGQLTVSSNDPQRPRVVAGLAGAAQEIDNRAFVQFVHNAVATGPVVVAFNGDVALRDFPYRAATAYEPFEAGSLEVRVERVDGELLFEDVIDLEAGAASVLVTCREAVDAQELRLVVVDGARREADSGDEVAFFVASGLVGFDGEPTQVDVRAVEPDEVFLADALATCERTGYQALRPGLALLEVDAEGQPGSFELDLTERGGQSLVLVVSGRLGADDEEEGLALLGFDADGNAV